MSNELENTGKILIYQNEKGDTKIDVYFEGDTIWMTQKSMCDLYQVAKSSISEHISNIFKDGELEPAATVRKFRTVQIEGNRQVSRELDYYNLDMILAVGYRVRSNVGMHFRRWASGILTEYMKKGFVLNDDRLRNPREFGADYFDELLERIKEIRASERRFYQKITDIYSQCSYDYDKDSEITQKFFKTVQNKLLFAVTQKTAPEIIHSRANSQKEHMGLTTWKDSPDGKIHKSDVTVSKNYLSKEEISSLNDIVTMYLDYAENQAKRNKLMSMQDWIDKLDSFLKFNEYELLHNAGFISSEVAKKLAIKEYEIFRVKQDESYVSDFDAAIKKYK